MVVFPPLPPPPPPPLPPPPSPPTPSLSNLIPTSAFIGTVCYVLGFLIVRFHLSTYGVNQIQVLSFRYVSTGVIFLVILLVPCAFLVIQSFLVSLTSSFTIVGLIFGFLGVLVSYIGLFHWLMEFFQVQDIGSLFSGEINNFTLNLGWFWTQSLSLFNFLLLYRSYIALPSGSFKKLFFLLTVFLFIIIISVLTQNYSRQLYPLITGTFGGGYPQEIQLIFQSDKIDPNQIQLFEKNLENKACLDFDESTKPINCKTKKLVILEELDKNYVILSKKQNSCLNGGKKDITPFLQDNYSVSKISKDFAPNATYIQEEFNPGCDVEASFQTVLRFEVNQNQQTNGKNYDYSVKIFRHDNDKDTFFMNLYNENTQIVEIKKGKVKRTIKNSGQSKETIYTYISSKPKILGYNQVIAKVNKDEKTAILEFKVNKNSEKSKKTEAKNNIKVTINNVNVLVENEQKKQPQTDSNIIINGSKIFVEPDSLESELTIKDLECTSPLVYYPTINDNDRKLIPNQKHISNTTPKKYDTCNQEEQKLLRKENKNNGLRNRLFGTNQKDKLFVKNEVKSLANDKIWYELFYKNTDNSNTSYVSGWIKQKT
ncbi:MAG: hypothetical protein QNJ33_02295 [Crocosphaera sp.]|nr:hypothetical protein [Crocosphaera sp.]